MSEEERVRVLRMVAAGSISPEEASDVLESLEPGQAMPPAAAIATAPPPIAVRNSRLTLQIDLSDGERSVTVRIPAGLAPAQRQFLLRPALPHLAQWDLDLDELLSIADQFPKDTTLLSLSENERSIQVKVRE